MYLSCLVAPYGYRLASLNRWPYQKGKSCGGGCIAHKSNSKEWSKQLPIVKVSINKRVHTSTGETPIYVNGLRHPRTSVSFVCSPSLGGGGPLNTLGSYMKERNGFTNVMAENRSSDFASVKSESRHTLSVLQRNHYRSSLAATTHIHMGLG